MSKKKIFEIGKKIFTKSKPKAQPKKQRAKRQSFKNDPSRIAAREIGKKQADPTIPADTGNLPEASKLKANDPGSLTTPQKAGGRRAGVQKAVNKDRKEIKSLENKIKKIKANIEDIKIKNKKMSDFHSQDKKGIGKTKSGKPLLAGIANNQKRLKKNTEELKSLTEQTSLIKNRINDMKSRNPVVKKAGGKIVARRTSGKVGKRKAGCKAGQGKAMRGF